MNIDTGLREAKLVDSSDGSDVNAVEIKIPDTQEALKELKVVEEEEEKVANAKIEELLEDIPVEEDSEADRALRDKIRLSSSSGQTSQLQLSIESVQKYRTLDARKLAQSLEVLAELGHELEFGAKIVDSSANHLLAIIKSKDIPTTTREIAARVLGASMRNNPGALSKVSGNDIVKSLLDTIDTSNNSQLNGRLIYAMGSVVSNGEGDGSASKRDTDYLENRGGEVLRRAFTGGNSDLKRKISTFVFDRALKLVWPDQEFVDWSDTFQDALVKNDLIGEDKLRVFEALTEMHEYTVEPQEGDIVKRGVSEMLPVRDDFLQWIARESDYYKGRSVDVDGTEGQYKDEILRARHNVYGNPLAARKNEEL